MKMIHVSRGITISDKNKTFGNGLAGIRKKGVLKYNGVSSQEKAWPLFTLEV